MAYNPNELLSEATGLGSGLRVMSTSTQPKTFASGSGTLAKCTPVTYNNATHKWNAWTGGITEVSRITANATPATDGTFTITINGQTTTALDHDAIASVVETALEVLSTVPSGEASVAEFGGGLSDANDGVIITFSGSLAEQDVHVQVDMGLIDGNVHVLSTDTEGLSNRIDGFLWPDDITLDSDEEILGQVMLTGRIHEGDIPIIAGYTKPQLDAALKSGQVRDSGIIVEGLEGFH